MRTSWGSWSVEAFRRKLSPKSYSFTKALNASAAQPAYYGPWSSANLLVRSLLSWRAAFTLDPNYRKLATASIGRQSATLQVSRADGRRGRHHRLGEQNAPIGVASVLTAIDLTPPALNGGSAGDYPAGLVSLAALS